MKTFTVKSRNFTELISLADAKAFLRVVGNDEDNIIQAMLDGAITYCENYLNRTIGVATYEMTTDRFTSQIRLMRPPVAAVTSIVYEDTDGAEQSFDISKVSVEASQGILYLNHGETWPATSPGSFIKITYNSNGLDKALEAADILDAIKLTLGYRYDYRDDPNQRWKKASDHILSQLRFRNFA